MPSCINEDYYNITVINECDTIYKLFPTYSFEKSLSRFNCSVDVLEQKTYASLGSLALKIIFLYLLYLLSLGFADGFFGSKGIVYYIYFVLFL